MNFKAKAVSVAVLLLSLGWGLDATASPPATALDVTEDRRSEHRYQGDPLAVRSLHPVFDTFPDSSLQDFSFLLDRPAGKHGFVEVGPDGHFRFSETGERARFWGVTVAASHVDIERQRIETVASVLARAGCNLLRLHELDNRGGEEYDLVRRNVIDEAYPHNNVSSQFDAEYRDRVDYWISCAQKKGMYVYLVLRGYRTFRPGDGVAQAEQLKRAAKPYAFFDPRLIELQKEYAVEWLFEHVNPYTGLPNGLNPAVALIEIENEDSLFFGHVSWRNFLEPYRTDFERIWNEWLRGEYGSTARLRQAWTDAGGKCALMEQEDLETGSVELPAMTLKALEDLDATAWTDPLQAPVRTRDGARFAADVQRRYFATMRDTLRSRGCRVPLTAVVHSGILLDTWTVAQELDFTAENAYVDHPAFHPGKTWVGKSFFSNNNPIQETGVWGLAPQLARYRWAGKPLVCREWTTCWPNEYRVSSLLDVASLGLLQDYDGLIHFAYYTWGDFDRITAFGPQADPLRWGLFGYAAQLFLQGELPADAQRIAIGFSDEDLSTWASYYRPLHRLAWTHRLENVNPDAKAVLQAEPPLLTITSGRSGVGGYLGNNHLLYDARYAARAAMPPEEQRKGLLARSGYDFPWIYRQRSFPVRQVHEAGYESLWPDETFERCLGFLDAARRTVVLSEVSEEQALAAAEKTARWLSTGARDALGRTFEPAKAELTALGGKLVRNTEDGVLRIGGERFCAVAGRLDSQEEHRAGALTLRSVSPMGAVVVASLDGKPLSESRRVAVKMATVARNRGQRLVAADDSGAPKPFVLEDGGAPPVQTSGQPSDTPTRILLDGRPIVEAYLVNGTWEAVFDLEGRQCRLFCDTPNVRFVIARSVFGEVTSSDIMITKYYYEYPPADAGQSGWDFIYPGFAKYVELSVE